MLHQSIPAFANAVELAEELGRARRVALAISDPSDLWILERYIAELEGLQIIEGVVPVE
jgi:hypothetical protein